MFISLFLWGFCSPSDSNAQEQDSSHRTKAKNDSAERSIPSDSILAEGLREAGADIAKMILDKDALGLMKYVDKNVYVTYGGDSYRSYDEVKADLGDTLSATYCHLFNISCYPGDLEKSIRDYLLEAESLNMKIMARVRHVRKAIWGTVVYDWDGKPKHLWVSDFPNPGFVYTENGWRFTSFFAE
jgi:hypothetical protein